jgi:hypothetical protein
VRDRERGREGLERVQRERKWEREKEREIERNIQNVEEMRKS